MEPCGANSTSGQVAAASSQQAITDCIDEGEVPDCRTRVDSQSWRKGNDGKGAIGTAEAQEKNSTGVEEITNAACDAEGGEAILQPDPRLSSGEKYDDDSGDGAANRDNLPRAQISSIIPSRAAGSVARFWHGEATPRLRGDRVAREKGEEAMGPQRRSESVLSMVVRKSGLSNTFSSSDDDDEWKPIAAVTSNFQRAPHQQPRVSVSARGYGIGHDTTLKEEKISPAISTLARDPSPADAKEYGGNNRVAYHQPPMSWPFHGGGIPAGVASTGSSGLTNQLQMPRELLYEDDDSDGDVAVVPLRMTSSARESDRQGRGSPLWLDEDPDAVVFGDDIFGERVEPNRDLPNNCSWSGGLFSRWGLARSAATGRSSARDSLAERDEFLSFTLPRQSPTHSTVKPSPWAKTMGCSPTPRSDDDMESDDNLFSRFGAAAATKRSDWLSRWSNRSTNSVASGRQLSDPGAAEFSAVGVEVDRWRECGVSGGQPHPTILSADAGEPVPWWRQMSSRFVDQFRGVEEFDSGSRCRNKKFWEGDNNDDASRDVRAWGWWDNLTRGPELFTRLCVCTLAVAALWLTSLSISAEIARCVLHCPTLQEVIGTVIHAYKVVEEQRDAHEKCVARQSAYCDIDFETYEVAGREEIITLLASTAATLKVDLSVRCHIYVLLNKEAYSPRQATEWTTSCNATLKEAQTSLKTWLAQGIGHLIIYSGNCTMSDERLTAGLLGDMSSSRENIHSSNELFYFLAVSIVSELSSYALNLSAYDSAYVASKTRVVDVYADRIVQNITFEVSGSLNATFQRVGRLGDVLVACASLRGDEDGHCPGENARTLADKSRQQLEIQLSAAREGFEAYEAAFAQYSADSDMAYAKMVEFYIGAMQMREERALGIVDDSRWSNMTLEDFYIPKPTLPSSNGILYGFPHAMTAEEIWDEVGGAQYDFEEGVAIVGIDIDAQVVELSLEWKDEAAQAVANISVAFDLDDFDPPRFGAVELSTESDSDIALAHVDGSFRSTAASFASRSLFFLDSLGPPGFNLSFPAAPPLESTFTVGNASTIVALPIDYTFEAFAALHEDFSSWLLSVVNFGVLLMVADYVFRCFSSVRLFIQFWDRAGLGVPEADLRVDKNASGATTIADDPGKLAAQAVLHPLTTVLLYTVIGGLAAYNLANLYVPLLLDYRAGCIERTQNGSLFSQNMYSIAYNYATESGNRARWTYQEDDTSRRGTLCVNLTADLKQYLSETNAELRGMYEKHHDDVAAISVLETCLDIDRMDSLYAEACCGQDGYKSTCSANSTLQCPLNYASGVAEAFDPVGLMVFDDACAEDTLEPKHWQTENDVALDCDIVFPCEMTCAGPSKELLRAVILHAGCTIEWFFHASLLKVVTIVVMFVLMNMSRNVIMSGIIKLTWRYMHAGIFTYKGTSTRAGELLIKASKEQTQQLSPRNDKRASSSSPTLPSVGHTRATPLKSTVDFFRHKVHRSRGGESPVLPRVEEDKDEPRKNFTGNPRGIVADLPEDRGVVGGGLRFKQIIAEAIEEGLLKYEKGARRKIAYGILLNLPWVVMLMYVGGATIVYNPV